MALIECPECRKNISDSAFSCPNCGYPLNNTSNQYKKIIPGRGLGISSMILGIFGVIYGLAALFSVFSPEYTAASAVPLTMIPIIFAVLSLVFGIVSHSKGYRKGIKNAGIILSVISFDLIILTIILACIIK